MSSHFDALRRLSGQFTDLARAQADNELSSLSEEVTGLPSKARPMVSSLWEENEYIALKCLHSPFVQGLVQGTVPSEMHQSYISDDYAFLTAYLKCYEVVLQHCPEGMPEVKAQIMELMNGICKEMDIQRDLLESWGLRTDPSASANTYIQYLNETSGSPDVSAAEIMIAMVPCARLYAWLGWRLDRACPVHPSPYAHWLDLYGSEEFWRMADMMEAVTEKLAEAVPDRLRLSTSYRRAMILELDFFDAQLAAAARLDWPPRPPLLLVVSDFEGTCTRDETLPLIAELAALADSRCAACQRGACKGAGEPAAAGAERGAGEDLAQGKVEDLAQAKVEDLAQAKVEDLAQAKVEDSAQKTGEDSAQKTGDDSAPGDAQKAPSPAHVPGAKPSSPGTPAPEPECSRPSQTYHEGLRELPSDRAVGAVRRLEDRLAHLVSNSSAKRMALLEEILPAAGAPPPPEFDMEWLGKFVDRVAEYEREMNREIVHARVLAHVRQDELRRAAADVHLQERCKGTLNALTSRGVPTCVVSMSWSGDFVAEALRACGVGPVELEAPRSSAQDDGFGGDGGEGAGAMADAPASSALASASPHASSSPLASSSAPVALRVYANELEFDGDGRATGAVAWRCESGADKGRQMDACLLSVVSRGDAAPDGVAVYVGDSMTDIPALISADIGILVGANPLARRVAAAAGITLASLDAVPLGRRQREQEESVAVVYEAASWEDIYAFFFSGRFALPRGPAVEPVEKRL